MHRICHIRETTFSDRELRSRFVCGSVKGKTKSAIWLGPPKGSGADKCKVSKPCTTGAGIKWDAKALGVNGGTYDAGKKGEISNRLFLKTPTYSDSKY